MEVGYGSAIELRIIDLTNWPSLEWSRILKTEDKAKLFRTCWQKLLKDQIDETVIHLINKTSLVIMLIFVIFIIVPWYEKMLIHNVYIIEKFKQLKDKLSNIGSEDGNLSAKIISFLIEKESEAVHTRKRRKIHAEYVKLGNESTKLDVVMELRNYEVAMLIVPKTMLAAESLLGPFIKNLLGFRHTFLMLNTKITRMVIARQSTPSPLLKPQRLTE
ncbi:hypothetical protein RhiirA1_451242 [Rhizophagus irregularis]|uniref:Uncharacterized protein n=1 Tax=Rhizophagus irregularis TaxID=588596 RepID=A0A2N0SCR9_9GLOM|nr:hypothetical protein RhiirA1_451242 [Rhizophagus irregularis]